MTVDFTRIVTEQFVVERCYKCAVSFAIPNTLYDNVHNKSPGTEFWCPNGHGQIYNTKSYQAQIADLERQTIRLRDERDSALDLKEKEARRRRLLEKRVKNGVCPCCKRSFRELAAHMKSQHPDYPLPQQKAV